MTFLLYIGKNKDFLRKFSKLENVQMIYAQNYQDAITICIRLKVRENIIVLHEQGEMNGDIEQVGAFRKKFYQAYVVLITDRLTPFRRVQVATSPVVAFKVQRLSTV